MYIPFVYTTRNSNRYIKKYINWERSVPKKLNFIQPYSWYAALFFAFSTVLHHLTLPLASDANIPAKQRAAKTMNAAFSLIKKRE